MSNPERDRIGEIQDRLRRIETRLTKYMQERGFDTQVQKCEWNEKEVEIDIPSLDIRLRDILAIVPDIPKPFDDTIRVVHKGVEILNFYLRD